MKVGVALNMLTQAGRPDVAVVSEHMALGDLAEPLRNVSTTLRHPGSVFTLVPVASPLVD